MKDRKRMLKGIFLHLELCQEKICIFRFSGSKDYFSLVRQGCKQWIKINNKTAHG